MIRVAVKYRGGTGADEIQDLEARHGLERKNEILPLNICGYDLEAAQIAELEKEALIDYIEREQSFTIGN